MAGATRGGEFALYGGIMQHTTRSADQAGFWSTLWFGVRNFAGGALVALGFGAAIAVLCFAIGAVIFAAVRAASWVVTVLAGVLSGGGPAASLGRDVWFV